jgi:tRNA A-37 threonylcarbamoyl transferase component Bud32
LKPQKGYLNSKFVTEVKANLFLYKKKGIELYSLPELPASAVDDIIQLCTEMLVEEPHGLSGRGATESAVISPLGLIRVKSYSRGGVWRRIVTRVFLKWGVTRSEAEFKALNYVRSLGIFAPEPIAYAYTGKILYKAWLITKELEGCRSLAEISRVDEERACEMTELLADSVWKLIDAGFVHIDLHPGNVLISKNGEPFIIDFDKAAAYPGTREQLRDFYIRRFRRAVIKHHLPEVLSEVFCLKLRKKIT